jgi:hypothetical protein
MAYYLTERCCHFPVKGISASYFVVYLETIREGGHVALLLCPDHFKLYRVLKDY